MSTISAYSISEMLVQQNCKLNSWYVIEHLPECRWLSRRATCVNQIQLPCVPVNVMWLT